MEETGFNWKWIGYLVIGLDLLIVNAAVAYMVFFRGEKTVESTVIPAEERDGCGPDCRAYIDSRLPKETTKPRITPTVSPSPTPTEKPVKTTYSAPKPKVRQVSYVAISGGDSTTASVWTDLSGTEFNFNTDDYPGLVEIYFESNMRLYNGNGAAYVRLFDVTHGIGVQGGEVTTSSQSSVVVTSGKLSFWAGNNLIRVQAKTLTADTAVFNSGRLKIVTEN